MAYKVIVSFKAQMEFLDALEYYNDVSTLIPARFIAAIEETYIKLSVNPFYQIRRNSLRAIPVKGFPYLLFFSVNESDKVVKILSCFHTSKHPRKYPN